MEVYIESASVCLCVHRHETFLYYRSTSDTWSNGVAGTEKRTQAAKPGSGRPGRRG